MSNPLTVSTNISASIDCVWSAWTDPTHIVQWCHASADWHCPEATVDLQVGGEWHYLIAAKDGSVEFDWWGTITELETPRSISSTMGDGRKMKVEFSEKQNDVLIIETFEPEDIHSCEMQQQGWQAILDNFKSYVESL